MGSGDTKSTPNRPTQESHASAEEGLGSREAAVTDREASVTDREAAILEREDAASLSEEALRAREEATQSRGELEVLTERLRDANEHLVVANVRAQMLADQAQQLAAIVESSNDAIIGKTLDGIVTSWNPGAEQLYGYSAQEMIGRHIRTTAPPDRADEAMDILEKIKRGEGVHRYDTQRVTKAGRLIDVSLTVSGICDTSGTLIGASIIARDITERKRAETQLRALLEAAPDATVIVDSSGRILTVNAQVERLLGYERHELLGQSVEILVPHHARRLHEVHRHDYTRAARPRPMGAGLDLTAVRKDGSEVAVEISLSPLETEEGTLVVAAIRDVTERKRMTEALRLSEAHLTHALEVSNLGSWEVSIPAAPTDRWSEQTFRILGWNAADGLRSEDEIRRLIHPDDVDRVSAQWSRAIRDLTRFDVEYRIVRPDGELRIVHSVGEPMKAGDGTTVRVVGTLQDVTDRRVAEAGREQLASIRSEDGELAGVIMVFRDVSERRRAELEREASLERERRARVDTERLAEAERAARAAAERAALGLRASEERLRITIASIGDAVLATDEEGRVTQLNPVAEALTGWKQADARGRPLAEVLVVVNEETRQPAPNPVERVLREGVVAGLANHTVLISKSGREIPIDDSAAPVRAEDGRLLGAVMVFRDITERRQAERERAARARVARELAAIVESSDDAIVSTDLDGTITAWNRAAEQMYGFTAEEAIGQSIRLIVSEDLWSEEDTLLRRIRRGEPAEHFETVRRRKDGTELPISITVSPIRDDTGTVIGTSKIARDITARKQIEAEKAGLLAAEHAARRETELAVQQLHAALRAGRMGTWQYIIGTGEVRWSEALEEIHGLTPGSFPGTFEAFRNEIYPEDRERVLAAIGTALEQRRDHHVEYRIVRPDGAVRWVEGVGQLVCDENGQPQSLLGVCVDITERAQMLARELAAREEIERASRLKDEFLAVLSHELRTPLNAVLGYAHLLSSGALPPERANHALEAIQRNAHAQSRLLESLLDLSRVMAGKLELNLEQVDISKVIESAVDVIRPQAEAKRITVEVVPPSHDMALVGDGSRLQQVFWNLLSNAVNFTPVGGRVGVRCVEEDALVRVLVTDNGQGINADFLPYIFDRFSQADSEKRRATTGLGLGLALVREMVQAHGGSVAAESPGEGHGSTFTVTLPLSITAATLALKAPLASQVEEPESLLPIDVLIVDDEADVRELLALLLESRGAVTRSVASANEAIEAISQRRPHVLLADLRMPGEDGYSLIRRVRAREREQSERRLPAIAVTAYASPRDRDQALAAGYDAHVAKPVEPAVLARTVAGVTRELWQKSV